MSYNDDAKMKLLKEAWQKMEEGDATYGAKVPGAKDPNGKNGLAGTKATGTAVAQGPSARATVAKATGGAENLAEGEEEDTGAPAGAADIGAGDAGAVDAGAAMGDMGADPAMGDPAAAVGSPWDQLVAAVDQMKTALEAIAAEESGEAEHMGGEDLGAEGDVDMGGEEPPIAEVAAGYLEEAKKVMEKKAAKVKEACKEEKKAGAKAAPKAFGGKQAPPFQKKK